jgi:hypothetical protein
LVTPVAWGMYKYSLLYLARAGEAIPVGVHLSH